MGIEYTTRGWDFRNGNNNFPFPKRGVPRSILNDTCIERRKGPEARVLSWYPIGPLMEGAVCLDMWSAVYVMGKVTLSRQTKSGSSYASIVAG